MFENCHLDKKGRSNEGCGDHLEYGGKWVGGRGGGEWGAETFSDRSETQTCCDIAVIDTDQ